MLNMHGQKKKKLRCCSLVNAYLKTKSSQETLKKYSKNLLID